MLNFTKNEVKIILKDYKYNIIFGQIRYENDEEIINIPTIDSYISFIYLIYGKPNYKIIKDITNKFMEKLLYYIDITTINYPKSIAREDYLNLRKNYKKYIKEAQIKSIIE